MCDWNKWGDIKEDTELKLGLQSKSESQKDCCHVLESADVTPLTGVTWFETRDASEGAPVYDKSESQKGNNVVGDGC